MKKLFFAVALLAAAVSFTGCGGEQSGEVTGITVSPKSVVLNDLEPSIKLAAKLTPASATAVNEIVWSSSDTTIATVTSKGFVEATAYGECYIIAQYGEFKDSCYVQVKTYLESLVFTGATYMDIDTAYYTVEGEPRIDTLKNGKLAYPCMVTLWAMSDGFYWNASGKLDGPENAALMEFGGICYYAPDYLNDGAGSFYVLGQWEVKETDDRYFCDVPGTLEEEQYINYMKSFVASYEADPEGTEWGQYLDSAAGSFSGPFVEVLKYNADKEGYTMANLGIHDAICTSANIYLNNDYPASPYMLGLDYCKIVFKPLATEYVFGGFNWGIDIDVDSDEHIYFVDDQVHYGKVITSEYGVEPQEEAPKYIQVPVPAIITDKEYAARVREQLNQKNLRTLRVK